MKKNTHQPSVDDLLKLTREVVHPFYQVQRAVPLRFAQGRFENDAEHSWSLALVACALAPHIDSALDLGKIAQFATVHDLVEIHAGDTSNFDDEGYKATKDERERAALHRLEQELVAFPWVCQTIETYESQQSEEAKFVKSVDKIIPLLFDVVEEGGFYQEHKITLERWKITMQKQREKASKHAGAFKYYDELWELLLANPQFFHQPAD
jgi:5'-deoxynucleotidase YfbR-like HD superfamily hydrolase